MKTTAFDPSKHLDDETLVAGYLNQVLAGNDADRLLAAIVDETKANGMGLIAPDAGVGRESLLKALAPGAKPRFDTMFKVFGCPWRTHGSTGHQAGLSDPPKQ